MAHIQTQYGGLWKPQDLTLDKISSQKMFIDNIDSMESFIKEGKQKVHPSVKTIADLKAIDTSDTALFTTGMLIMVHEVGIFCFNRNTTGTSTDSDDIIVPTTGGGEWISTNINSAPAGYGLGTTPKKITDWNDAKLDGWYYSSEGAVNAPDPTIWCFGRVDNHGNQEVCVQEVWGLANINKYYHWIRLIYPTGGTPWEWPEPPFVVDTVYRTTERHLGNPVYKKMDSNGVIWWSTDQSTWKCESERVGAYSKTETDSLLQKKANPNLLDNWYFANPVNQRGKTEQYGSGYFIDRWTASEGKYVLTNNGLTLCVEGVNSWIAQLLDVDVEGQIITVSALTADGKLYTSTGRPTKQAVVSVSIDGGGYVSCSYTTGFSMFQFTLARFDTTLPITIRAAKLELGSKQTLAHQDANGNWVLNEIPDYSEQLLRCCISKADTGDPYANNKMTAAAVNAVPIDGSKIVTGKLLFTTATYNGSLGASTDSGALRIDGGTNYDKGAFLTLFGKDGGQSGVFQLVAGDGGMSRELKGTPSGSLTWDNNTILHTGNKPSGSYTGNGSSVERRIEVGGFGDAIFIRSTNDFALVCYNGAILKVGTNVSGITKSEVKYENGVLTMKSTKSALNTNGIIYYYQVL